MTDRYKNITFPKTCLQVVNTVDYSWGLGFVWGVLVLLKFDKNILSFIFYGVLFSVDFHTLTLQLPIQTQNSVVPELQAFVSSLPISVKQAYPWAKSLINLGSVCTEMSFLCYQQCVPEDDD